MTINDVPVLTIAGLAAVWGGAGWLLYSVWQRTAAGEGMNPLRYAALFAAVAAAVLLTLSAVGPEWFLPGFWLVVFAGVTAVLASILPFGEG